MRRCNGCARYNAAVNFLVVDTSGSAMVLGLAKQADVLDRTSGEVKTHSREILPSIERLLNDAGLAPGELDAIIYGQGPGSFTGLRIAVGVVQGLAYGLQIPVVPVSSMAAMAHAAACANDLTEAKVFVGLFARLEEIYFGAYHLIPGHAPGLVVREGVLDVAELPALNEGPWLAVGNAAELWRRIETSTGVKFESITENATPSVQSLLELGQQAFAAGNLQDAMHATPVYLREQVADKPGNS